MCYRCGKKLLCIQNRIVGKRCMCQIVPKLPISFMQFVAVDLAQRMSLLFHQFGYCRAGFSLLFTVLRYLPCPLSSLHARLVICEGSIFAILQMPGTALQCSVFAIGIFTAAWRRHDRPGIAGWQLSICRCSRRSDQRLAGSRIGRGFEHHYTFLVSFVAMLEALHAAKTYPVCGRAIQRTKMNLKV